MPNPLKCCNCGKKIAEEVSIQSGTVKITCKCGTVNEVKAAVKPREQYQTKDGLQAPIRVNTAQSSQIGYKAKPPFGFNCTGDMIDANGARLK